MPSRPFGQINRNVSGVNCKNERGDTPAAVSGVRVYAYAKVQLTVLCHSLVRAGASLVHRRGITSTAQKPAEYCHVFWTEQEPVWASRGALHYHVELGFLAVRMKI